jgi:hypothetical protein
VHAEVFAFAAARCLHHHNFHDNRKTAILSTAPPSTQTIPTPLSTLCAPLSSRPFVRLLHPGHLDFLVGAIRLVFHLNSAIPAIVVEISAYARRRALGIGVEVFFLTCSERTCGSIVGLDALWFVGDSILFELFLHFAFFFPRNLWCCISKVACILCNRRFLTCTP